jgi:hypothetical protein
MRLTAWKMAIAFVEQGFNFGATCSNDDIVALPCAQKRSKEANVGGMIQDPAGSHGPALRAHVLNASLDARS